MLGAPLALVVGGVHKGVVKVHGSNTGGNNVRKSPFDGRRQALSKHNRNRSSAVECPIVYRMVVGSNPIGSAINC